MNHTVGIMELDLHGKTVYQAMVAIDAALRRRGGAYRLRLIHGHNMGCAIKDAVYARYGGDNGTLTVEQGANPGITELLLRKI